VITHVVLMKFTDAAHALEARQRLESLVGVVPEVESLHVGLDVVHSEASYDLCLTTTHADLEALGGYQQHPAHVDVAGWLKTVLAARAVVDSAS
jgi:hypothetical protein